jgi:chromate transporter
VTGFTSITYQVPREAYFKLFLRFLRFGLLAWGGPVAQIDMIRQELVEEEQWISSERFNRVLAVYQALPGPEAHELCVYFGMLSRGQAGALLAGVGFMLPGFVLMFSLSWFYAVYGIHSPVFSSAFLGMQPAVAALIVRAVHRIGGHALHRDKWLWGIALVVGPGYLLEINFFILLLAAGLVYSLASKNRAMLAYAIAAIFLAVEIMIAFRIIPLESGSSIDANPVYTEPSVRSIFLTGLKSGLLTFGGAYTVIPFLQQDAVEAGRWLTSTQFLDGLALSGLLPAPLIIFSTFVGYIGGGPIGALAITVGIFAPAFAFTMFGHGFLDRLVENQTIHAFLDGITAGVVGLISATAVGILTLTLTNLPAWGIFSLALLALFRFRSKWTVATVVLLAGLFGLLFFTERIRLR